MCSASVLMKRNIRLFFEKRIDNFYWNTKYFYYTYYTIYLYLLYYLFISTFITPLYVIPVDNTTVQDLKKRERKNHGIHDSVYTVSVFGGSTSFCIQGAAIQNHTKEIHGKLLNV